MNTYQLIQKYFPQSEWGRAVKVMMGESGGKPTAVGDNYPIRGQTIPSYGLFQIRALPGRPDPKVLLDPEENVKYAAKLWATQGWNPWTVAKKLGYAGKPQGQGNQQMAMQNPQQSMQNLTPQGQTPSPMASFAKQMVMAQSTNNPYLNQPQTKTKGQSIPETFYKNKYYLPTV